MSSQIIYLLWSAFSAVTAVIFGLVLAFLWPRRHVPIIGYLWLFMLAMGFRNGVTAVLLVLGAASLLPEDRMTVQLLFFAMQFLTTLPALLLAGFVLQVIPAGPVRWLFPGPDEKGDGDE